MDYDGNEQFKRIGLALQTLHKYNIQIEDIIEEDIAKYFPDDYFGKLQKGGFSEKKHGAASEKTQDILLNRCLEGLVEYTASHSDINIDEATDDVADSVLMTAPLAVAYLSSKSNNKFRNIYDFLSEMQKWMKR
jgi:hypothetical protein